MNGRERSALDAVEYLAVQLGDDDVLSGVDGTARQMPGVSGLERVSARHVRGYHGQPFAKVRRDLRNMLRLLIPNGRAAAVHSPPLSPRSPWRSRCDSDLETNRIKERKFEERKDHSIAAGRHKREAQAHYDDFRKTVKAFFIQSLASTLLIGLLAPEAEGDGPRRSCGRSRGSRFSRSRNFRLSCSGSCGRASISMQ